MPILTFIPSLPLPTRPPTQPSPRYPPPSCSLTTEIRHTLTHLSHAKIILCIRQPTATLALKSAEAALSAGLTAIEIALTTPEALPLITHLSTHNPSAKIAAGTVLTPTQATAAHNAGAAFLLSPTLSPPVLTTAASLNLLAIPGAATPSEISTAYDLGAPVVKVFPISLYGGLHLISAMAGPFPHIPLLPSSGVTLANLPDYLAAPNVPFVAASREILHPSALAAQDWPAVTARAAKWAALAASLPATQIT